MLMNVMNSYDPELIVRFFTHFCISNCHLFDDSTEATTITRYLQHHQNSLSNTNINTSFDLSRGSEVSSLNTVGSANAINSNNNNNNNNNNMGMTVCGPENIALHMLRGMDLVPDCVVRLRQASIHQVLNTTGSRIVCKVRMSGTKLFKYAQAGSAMLQILQEASTQKMVYNVLQTASNGEAKLSIEDITEYFLKVMVPEPIDVSFNATITMYLDEEHRIYRFDFYND
jgi:RIO-like serine/threonine protein kinase